MFLQKIKKRVVCQPTLTEKLYFRHKIKTQMKKILLMSALSVAMLGAVNAQTTTTAPARTASTAQQSPAVKAKFKVSDITKAVALEGDQFAKVNAIYLEYFNKLETLGASATPAQKAELDKVADTALKGVLTAEQYKRWTSSPK